MSYPVFFQDNRFADATPVASGTTAGDPANVADLRNYTFWQPNALPATLTVDCGSAKALDSLAVYGHNLHTKGCTLELRGSTDNFSTSDVLVKSITPADDDPFAACFASASYRYWRLKITGSATPTLAIVVAGAAVYMPAGISGGLEFGRKLNGTGNINDNGQPLGKIINFVTRSTPLNFSVERDWLLDTFEGLWDGGLRGAPVLLAPDLDRHPGQLWLGMLGDEYSAPVNSYGGSVPLTFNFNGTA